jgi:glycosyltransferase involved in cell wall biosynthesis
MHLLLLGNGSLEQAFRSICNVQKFPTQEFNPNQSIYKKTFSKIVGNKAKNDEQKNKILSSLQTKNFDLIYANTIATAWVLPELLNFVAAPIFSHIHELEFSIQLYSKKEDREFLFEKSSKIIACSNAVSENINTNHQVPISKIDIIHSFVDNENVLLRCLSTDNEAIKQKYNLPSSSFLIGGCGNAEWRKGIDIFIQVANQITNSSNENCHFVWIGVKKEGEYYEQISYDIEKIGLKNKVTFIEPTPDAIELISCLDIFTIVSREDPFPLVMLEAALAQKTMIGFENTGGCSEFIEEDAGILIPYLNTQLMAGNIIKLFKNQSFAKQLGQKAKEKVLKKYSFANSIIKIEELLKSFSV